MIAAIVGLEFKNFTVESKKAGFKMFESDREKDCLLLASGNSFDSLLLLLLL